MVKLLYQIIRLIVMDPSGLARLVEDGVLDGSLPESVPLVTNPEEALSSLKICRPCAYHIFLWGIVPWWVKELGREDLPLPLKSRRTCPGRSNCQRQQEVAHCKECKLYQPYRSSTYELFPVVHFEASLFNFPETLISTPQSLVTHEPVLND